MQRWEYMTWLVSAASVGHWPEWTVGKVRYKNGRRLRDWEHGLPLSGALDRAGAQGWELVSLDNNATMYVFKRPVQAPVISGEPDPHEFAE